MLFSWQILLISSKAFPNKILNNWLQLREVKTVNGMLANCLKLQYQKQTQTCKQAITNTHTSNWLMLIFFTFVFSFFPVGHIVKKNYDFFYAIHRNWRNILALGLKWVTIWKSWTRKAKYLIFPLISGILLQDDNYWLQTQHLQSNSGRKAFWYHVFN